MSANPRLLEALQDRRLFRAGQPLARGQGATPSGFDALDEALPWGGFPRGALTEILLPAPGMGEIELIAAAWRRIGARERLAIVAPPCVPYAPALRAQGLPLARLAWIEAPLAQAPWAAEQCLRAGCVGAVALWFAGGDDRSLRRLQLAAEEGSCHGFVFRPLRHAANPSPSALRLQLEATPGALRLRVLKCRGAVAPAFAVQRERCAGGSTAHEVTAPASLHEARRPAPVGN
jgi:hypothetical protein